MSQPGVVTLLSSLDKGNHSIILYTAGAETGFWKGLGVGGPGNC